MVCNIITIKGGIGMRNKKSFLKFLLLSGIGIFVFFVPVSIGGRNTIPLDHIIVFFKKEFPATSRWIALGLLFYGSISPFFSDRYKKSLSDSIFSILKVFGFVFALMIITGKGFKVVLEPSIGGFLFDKLVVSVGLIVPVGAIFLSFLIDYGLLEFIGVLMQPFMKPVFKTPGRSAIDAVASFVGSYSIGLLITDRVYKKGVYSTKEAVIIATGFSTVSATFMIIVCKTLNLMAFWNTYFWATMLVTFTTTAITARLYPITRFSEKKKIDERKIEVSLNKAIEEAINASTKSGSVLKNIKQNFIDGIKLAGEILPSIMSIGLIGLVLADKTNFFDILGYVFYPLTYLLHSAQPVLLAKASALSISEMYLPVLISAKGFVETRFVVAILSVSSILFFSASIPCILATTIPIKIKDIVLIWFERVVISLLLAIPITKFLIILNVIH